MSPYYIAFVVWATYATAITLLTGTPDRLPFGIAVGFLCSALYDMWKDDV